MRKRAVVLSTAATETSDFEGLRRRVDELNRQLLTALEARGRVVQKIMAYKRAHGMSTHDAKREEAMLDELTAQVHGPYSGEQIATVFQAIFEISRALGAEYSDAHHSADTRGKSNGKQL
ncbi:MAG: chorismate mutase [Povalibacter sp.]